MGREQSLLLDFSNAVENLSNLSSTKEKSNKQNIPLPFSIFEVTNIPEN